MAGPATGEVVYLRNWWPKQTNRTSLGFDGRGRWSVSTSDRLGAFDDGNGPTLKHELPNNAGVAREHGENGRSSAVS
jgi:hypothetical protein